jgi:aspartyl aminopeptidase
MHHTFNEVLELINSEYQIAQRTVNNMLKESEYKKMSNKEKEKYNYACGKYIALHNMLCNINN